MRYHHQNLTDERLPLWRHGRAWLGPIGWEWGFMQGRGFSISAGLRSAHLRLGFFSFYLHTNSEEARRGSFSLRFDDGIIWIEHPWVRQMEWRSSDPMATTPREPAGVLQLFSMIRRGQPHDCSAVH